MKWNPEKRQYEDSRGKPIPPAKVREWIEDYISANKDEIEAESDKMLSAGASAVLITSLFSFLRERVKTMHQTSGVIAYGGESEMNPDRWARIADKIESEYKYLASFEQAVIEARRATDEIVQAVRLIAPESASVVEAAILTQSPSSAAVVVQEVAPIVAPRVEPLWDSMLWGEVGSRSRSYADASYSTWANSEKAREQDAGMLEARRVCEDDDSSCEDCPALATEEYLPLAEVADIGDSQCQTRCRCRYEFNYHGIEPLTVDRASYVG